MLESLDLRAIRDRLKEAIPCSEINLVSVDVAESKSDGLEIMIIVRVK